MTNRIYKKFLLAFFTFISICAIIIVLFGRNFVYRYLVEEKAKALRRIGTKISNDLLIISSDDVKLDKKIYRLNKISEYESIEIWIVGADGRVIYTSNESKETKNNEVLGKIYPYEKESYYGIGKFDGRFQEEKLSVINTIVQGYKIMGYIVLHYDYSEIRMQGDAILRIFFIIIGVILLIALFVFGILSVSVIRPINKITKAVKEYSAGNLGYIVDVSVNDEIGLLAAALNDMSSELEKTEEYQKRLIANVSHDFRSPLTSIKGYIEAILDGTIPETLQEKYLNTVLMEANRLSGLTEELLELNKADSNKLQLDIQPININSLIRNTVTSFEQRCIQRNITIELIFENDDTMVLADLSRIQQVLYNLLDNAIKFSSNDSEIVIETTSKKDKLMISVKDYGCGIVSSELKKIWERFYKSDTSRGRDKASSGLGLSIVKEIIQLHNENINVVSTQDAGTTFIFTLKLIEEE